MTGLRPISDDALARIPGLHFLTHVGELHSETVPGGSRHHVCARARASSEAPGLYRRGEWSHVTFVETSYNLSHWITDQLPELVDVPFKSATVFPRGMGMPPLPLDEEVDLEGRALFQRVGGRWRGEIEVVFYRADGTRAETVTFPLVERTAVR